MWGNRLCLFGVSEVINITCIGDELIGDLFVFLGQPQLRVDVTFTVDACDVGSIAISSNFIPGSTFQFNCINGGRILGIGGNGGAGGNDFGATGTGGFPGGNGNPALSSTGFDVGVDIDDGFLLGGGGGGGGGSYNFVGPGGTPGGGGGGGIGFNATSGGVPGSGSPSGLVGVDGTRNAPGAGGAGGTSGTNDGNVGGTWGAGGITGDTTLMYGASFATNFLHNGGSGGRGGNAFIGLSGATISLNGISTESTLRAADRLMGETEHQIVLAHELWNFNSESALSTTGWTFQSDGTLRRVKASGNLDYAQYWIGDGKGTGFGADYSIRQRSLGAKGAWNAEAAANDVYIALSVNRTWSIEEQNPNGDDVARLFEIKRTTRADTEILASGFFGCTDEAGN